MVKGGGGGRIFEFGRGFSFGGIVGLWCYVIFVVILGVCG